MLCLGVQIRNLEDLGLASVFTEDSIRWGPPRSPRSV